MYPSLIQQIREQLIRVNQQSGQRRKVVVVPPVIGVISEKEFRAGSSLKLGDKHLMMKGPCYFLLGGRYEKQSLRMEVLR